VLTSQHAIHLVHARDWSRDRQLEQSQEAGICHRPRDRRIVELVATERQQARCRERVERLSESSLDCESIRREVIGELQRLIGFDRWCWPLSDPETLLPNGGIAEHDFGPGVPRSLELEYSSDDYAAKRVLARHAKSAGSLNTETGGDLGRSARWDEVLRPVGIGDVAAVACRDALGCWGWIEAYRDRSDRPFGEQDVELLGSIGPCLGSALRRTMYATDGAAVEPSPPGVIVLDSDLKRVSSTANARAWIDVLPSAKLFAAFGMLPSVVYPAAALARTARSAADAHALLRGIDGRWVMIEAAALKGHREGEIAVTLRAATASETSDLLCRAYALSQRERDVVGAVTAGLDTRAVAKRLFISAYTVQDHLKSVFEKIGVHSRRELLARFSASADTR
jgi:DNA-binding CsgD family transcriptional regulator